MPSSFYKIHLLWRWLFNIRREALYVPSGYDGWQLSAERINSFVYDEQGFVKEVWDRRTSGDSLRLYGKIDFYNNDVGRPDSAYLYNRNDGEFDLVQQWYFEWEEWYGFDSWGEGYLYDGFSVAYRQRVPIGNKRNKRILLEERFPEYPGTMLEIRTSWGAFDSFVDSLFVSYDSLQTKSLIQLDTNTYNEFGDFVEARQDYWHIDEDGNRVQAGNTNECYLYVYTDYGADGIGRDVEEYCRLQWNTILLQYDSIKQYRSKVLRYRGGIEVGIDDLAAERPVFRSELLVAPNPATHNVTISAAEDIREVELYDLTGRRIRSWQSVASKTAKLSIERIPTGVYLIKAVLQTGAVQTAKVVVQ